jgi:hypothetical protein
MNAWLAMRRIQFRAYVHPREPMLAAAAGRGFRLADRHDGIVWQSFVLERAAPSGA